MKGLDSRVKKLEVSHKNVLPPRIVVVGVPACPEGGRCEHIVGAEVGGKVFARHRGEALDVLKERAIAEGGRDQAPFVMVTYVTAHDAAHGTRNAH